MEDADRFRLLGKYRAPRFRIGQRVRCAVRGEMIITSITDAPIPWPVGRRGPGRHSLIVYEDLAKALRRESNQAISHWWGVDPQTVTKWRRALGVDAITEGTNRLHSEHIAEFGDAMRQEGVKKARDPERRRKISESMRGKPRPSTSLTRRLQHGGDRITRRKPNGRLARHRDDAARWFPVRFRGRPRRTS
jgi:hypothetical protein